MSTLIDRDPQGQPSGGQFAARQHPDAEIVLPPSRTTIGGYEMRSFKSGGVGTEGLVWSATIYRDGTAVMHVIDDGSGGGLRYVEKSTGQDHVGPEIDRLKRQAQLFHPEYGEYSDGVFIETLHLAATLDKQARDDNTSFPQTVEAHFRAGALTEDEREILLRPEQFGAVG